MRSLPPHFHEPASEEDDARWAAYQALQARNARAEAEAEVDPVEEASPSGDEDELLTLDRDVPEAPIHAPPREAMGRGLRLVGGVAAITAGLVLALALVPHAQREPAVIVAHAAAPANPRVTLDAPPAAPTSGAPPASPDRVADRHRLSGPRRDVDIRADASPAHSPYGALSCWLTLMNNSEATGYADAGVSICQKKADAVPGSRDEFPAERP